MKVTIQGIPKAKETLKNALTIDNALRKILTSLTAERLRAEIYARTPFRTGALRAAGAVSVLRGTIAYTNPKPYAPYLEWGTGRRGERTWKDFYGAKRYKDYVPEPYTPRFKKDWPGMRSQAFLRPAIVVVMDELTETLRHTIEEKLK
jgi:hypothetical protein